MRTEDKIEKEQNEIIDFLKERQPSPPIDLGIKPSKLEKIIFRGSKDYKNFAFNFELIKK